MATAQIIEQLTQLTDVERLEVIQAATRLIRENLAAGSTAASADRDQQMRAAASSVRELYEAGDALTEWAALDAEDFADEHLPR